MPGFIRRRGRKERERKARKERKTQMQRGREQG
jgi:hypothetical protein